MEILIDLILIYALSLTHIVSNNIAAESLITLLLSFALVSLLYCFSSEKYPKYFYFIVLLYWVVSMIFPSYLIYIGAICYLCILNYKSLIALIYILPLVNFMLRYQTIAKQVEVLSVSQSQYSILVILFIFSVIIGIILGFKTRNMIFLKKRITDIIDTNKEHQLHLESQNQHILSQQNNEIQLATLNERNRIAREIHDNVGHMLSRCILQVGALISINKDPNLSAPYETLKNSLDEAMTNIRSSVHDLHEDSVDLKKSITQITEQYTFCNVNLDYDISPHINTDIKYCFIAIVKEALNNTMKHSDATSIQIRILEHPSFYQLYISDNGSKSANNSDPGIGLTNMRKRVTDLNGYINITQKEGYTINITIPKENK